MRACLLSWEVSTGKGCNPAILQGHPSLFWGAPPTPKFRFTSGCLEWPVVAVKGGVTVSSLA